MSKLIWVGLIVVVVVIAAFFIFGRNNNTDLTPDLTPPAIPNMPNNGGSNAQTYDIEISNFAYSPSSLTINAGDTVIWTNRDSVEHTVTSDSGSELASQLFSDGETYSHTFNSAGEYTYHCIPHPNMKAKIIVQ